MAMLMEGVEAREILLLEVENKNRPNGSRHRVSIVDAATR